MDVQELSSGRWLARYDKVEYQSPLWIVSQSDTEIVYAASYQGQPIARVYKKDGEWFLATAYLSHWQPVPTFSKYEGFLLLLNIKKQNEL